MGFLLSKETFGAVKAVGLPMDCSDQLYVLAGYEGQGQLDITPEIWNITALISQNYVVLISELILQGSEDH